MKELLENIQIQDGYVVSEAYGLRKDYFYVLCPYGIGDTLYVSMMIRSYCLYHGITLPVCYITKENHADIPSWFDCVDSLIASNDFVTVMNLWAVTNRFWRGNNFLYGHFPKGDAGLDQIYHQTPVKNMIYRYRTITMQLPEHIRLEKPQLPKLSAQKAQEAYGVNKRTIIFMPYAVPSEMLPIGFWENLAAIFRKLGYRVLTNVKDETEAPVQGTEAIAVNIEMMAALAEQAKGVISMRSGICDVLAQTDAALVIINSSLYLHEEWDVTFATDRRDILNILYDSDDKAMNAAVQILQYFNISV